MCQTSTNQKDGQDGARADESKKIAIVSATNTIVEPHAVMVEGFDTVVADAAVIAARRPPNTTCLAVFHRHVHGSYI